MLLKLWAVATITVLQMEIVVAMVFVVVIHPFLNFANQTIVQLFASDVFIADI